MSNLLVRVLCAIIVGIVTFFIVWIILALLSAILPFVTIDSRAVGVIFGVIAGIVYFLSGKTLA